MSKLFSPLKIKSLELRNRIIVSPMCQYSSVDGFANEWHLVHLGGFAVGGAAVVCTEATAVSPEGRISLRDLGIWQDSHLDFLTKITTFIKAQGAIPAIQLAHAGRKASTQPPWLGNGPIEEKDGGWKPQAPSALAFKEGQLIPQELTIAKISVIIEQFGQATQRALAAGFQIIELHGAHGYLINEFLSPISNLRTDQYGGSFQNRCRFLLEIIESVKKVWPEDLPLFVRLSITEWVDGGWTVADSIELAKILKNDGVDLIDCSSGGNAAGARITVKPLYQVELAQNVKQASGIMTGAVGLITTPQQAEEIIASKQADLIFMAREFLRDPHFPMRAAHELSTSIIWPKQYERARLK